MNSADNLKPNKSNHFNMGPQTLNIGMVPAIVVIQSWKGINKINNIRSKEKGITIKITINNVSAKRQST